MSGSLPGTQEVKRRMGRYGFAARIVYGTGVFCTISPSERHGCLAIRLSRYRAGDPVLEADSSLSERQWIGQDAPSLELLARSEPEEETSMLLPEYDGWWLYPSTNRGVARPAGPYFWNTVGGSCVRSFVRSCVCVCVCPSHASSTGFAAANTGTRSHGCCGQLPRIHPRRPCALARHTDVPRVPALQQRTTSLPGHLWQQC